MLLVSHDINLVRRHADRSAVCHDGRIVEIDEAPSLLHRPQHLYTMALLSAAPRAGDKMAIPVKPHAEIALEAKNVSRVDGRGAETVRAVVKADLSVRHGEIVGIYGTSGCGCVAKIDPFARVLVKPFRNSRVGMGWRQTLPVPLHHFHIRCFLLLRCIRENPLPVSLTFLIPKTRHIS